MSNQLQTVLQNLTPAFKLLKKKKKGVSAGGSSDVLPLGVYEKVPVELESHAALTLVFIKW